MDALVQIHGRKIGLGPNGELLIEGKTIILDNGGVPTPVAQVGSAKFIGAGAAKTLTRDDSGKTVKLDTLAGSVVTLPAAIGSGAKFKLLVTVLATSNSHKVQVANSTDVMIGIIPIVRTDTAAVLAYAAAAASDTITLNRSSSGSVSLGEWIEIEDVAAGVFEVKGMLSATGAQATPFSAAV